LCNSDGQVTYTSNITIGPDGTTLINNSSTYTYYADGYLESKYDELYSLAGGSSTNFKSYSDEEQVAGPYGGPNIPDTIILNLQGEKVQTISLTDSSVYFDRENNGNKVQTGWVTAGEGLLVYDPDGSNAVSQESDLVPGFTALKELDSNSDDVLNASDTTWNQLKVWVDTTGDGDFQSNELHSLDQLDITSINLNAESVNQVNNGNIILDDSTFSYSDGTTGDIAGVDLIYNPSPAQGDGDNRLNSLIAAMASFNPQAADQTQSSLIMQTTLEQLIAVNSH